MAETPANNRIAERKLRDKQARRAQIISAARRIAELEGWSSVTVRRLSDEISYSQPVLYAHFGSREGVLAAVAIEGFQELGLAMEKARKRVKRGSTVGAVADAYLEFAAASPALYEVMFSLSLSVPFDDAATPSELRFAFSQFWSCFRGKARNQRFSLSCFGRVSMASPSLQEPSDSRLAVRKSACWPLWISSASRGRKRPGRRKCDDSAPLNDVHALFANLMSVELHLLEVRITRTSRLRLLMHCSQVAVKRQDSIGAAPRDQACAVDGDRAEQVG